MPRESLLASRYRDLLDRIAGACRRSGRSAADVSLVAVTKSAEVPAIRELVACGAHDLGESRVQQLAERVPRVSGPVRWHFIGPLQRNKVRRLLPLVEWIHSIDSARLLARVDEVAGELQLQPRVLLEVNVSGEQSKGGFRPDEIEAAWPEIAGCSHARIEGLMTMAPLVEKVEEARPVFRGLRLLRDRLVEKTSGAVPLPELSMGMTQDFEIAVEEGATMVRVGSLLFEGLETDGADPREGLPRPNGS